jgi:hypothetical protein
MLISEKIAYPDSFALEPATNRLQRTVDPTLYSRMEIGKRMRDGNTFVKRAGAAQLTHTLSLALAIVIRAAGNGAAIP